jgi:hypothetical protein
LKAELNIPVQWFPTGVMPVADPIPFSQRKYDIGFVGGNSPRRERLLHRLAGSGYTLSPQEGVVFEEAIAQSKISLNIHMHKSLHLEYPRILGSFSTGAALITEKSHGMHQAFPKDIYLEVGYKSLFDTLSESMLHLQDMESMAHRGYKWLSLKYIPESISKWSDILDDVDRRLAQC